jgi:hypothetical protein
MAHLAPLGIARNSNAPMFGKDKKRLAGYKDFIKTKVCDRGRNGGLPPLSRSDGGIL